MDTVAEENAVETCGDGEGVRLCSVAVGRKNYLFFGSDKGGESAAIIYSLLVTCKLNGVEPEDWLREVIRKINDWPSNRVHELLPWNLSAVK